MPCTGDHKSMCGGKLRLSVYESGAVPGAQVPEVKAGASGRPLLALVMIVKDEVHTLGNTLLPLLPYIDAWYILDTGSTDGTQALVRKTMGSIPGYLGESPFIDYGTSRNEALDMVLQQEMHLPLPVFCMMLSADETVYNVAALRSFLQQHVDSVGIQKHEAYKVQMDVGWRFDSVRVIRTDANWRYVGRVHEYLAPPARKYRDCHRVPDVYIKFHATDPERRTQREYKILEILLREKREEPENTRTQFYLARTYNAIKNHTAALAAFEERVAMGGWKEEVYESMYAIAWQKKHLKRDWFEVQQAFMDAHNQSPHRAEPLYCIADHWMVRGKMSLAFMFAQRAAQLPYPEKAVLWVQRDVYKWQVRYVLAMTALHPSVAKYELGARALLEALRSQPKNKPLLGKVEKYKEHLGEDTWQRLERLVDEEGVGSLAGPPLEPLATKPATSSEEPPASVNHVEAVAALFLGVLLGLALGRARRSHSKEL